MKKQNFVAVTVLVALAGLALPFALAPKADVDPHADAQSHAQWAFVADSLDGLTHYADTIVVARAGESSPSRIDYTPDGSYGLPHEITDFEVMNVVKGSIAEGRLVTVERTGGEDDRGHYWQVEIDGGAYESGQIYLLFLREQPDTGFHYLVNEQGRFQLIDDLLVAADPEDEVAAVLHLKPVEYVLDLLDGMAGNR